MVSEEEEEERAPAERSNLEQQTTGTTAALHRAETPPSIYQLTGGQWPLFFASLSCRSVLVVLQAITK